MDIGTESGLIWVVFGSIFLLLFLFGCLFAIVTYWIHKRGFSDGYTWLLVVVGNLVTIAGYWALPFDNKNVLALIACFAFSGAPMALGNIWEYVDGRREVEQRIAND